MKIMSLNGWGGLLHKEITAYLAEERPDILCLQEVTVTPSAPKPHLDYRDGSKILDQRADFLADVAAVLPDHTAVFCPAAEGVLWDGANAVPSHWGLATFVRRDLPVIGQIQGFVHKDFSSDGYGDHPRSRSAHGIRVYDRRSDRAVGVVHMHGLRDPAGKMDTPERSAQAQRLLGFSKTLAEPGDLRIICGDFNVEPDSETLQLLKSDGLTELVTAGGFAGTRTSHYPKAGRFADYMLISEPEVVQDFQVVGDPEVSDHCPLLLHL